MTLTESSIYISLKRLRRLLFSAQFNMTKANRIVYGTPIMENIGNAIASYVLAFTVMEKKLEYIEEAIGWFAVVRTDCQSSVRNGMSMSISTKTRCVFLQGRTIPKEIK